MNSHLDFHSTAVSYESAYCAQSHDHLSDDQIDDLLIGDLTAAPAAHLASCSLCADRVAEASDPIACFQNMTMAWSERRSATLPIPDLSQQRPLWQRHMAFATACFTFVIGIALINASQQVALKTAELQSAQLEPTQQQPAQLQSTQQQPTQLQPAELQPTRQVAPPAPVLTETASVTVAPLDAQISADNQMLKDVDNELDTSAVSPAALGLEPVSDHSTRTPSTTSVQD